jgi:hypothetical protein
MVRIPIEQGKVAGAAFQFMRHNDKNETFFCALKDEGEALSELTEASAALGTKLSPKGDQVQIELTR